MNPINDVIPLYLNTPTIYNNKKINQISFNIVECDTMFSIIINNKAILEDMPKTIKTIPQLSDYKELLFALKTTMLIINAEVFGTNREPNAKIIVKIEEYGFQDLAIGIKVLEGEEESLSGVVKFADKDTE